MNQTMRTTSRIALILIILVGCLVGDQLTKYVARALLQGRGTIYLLGGILQIGYTENLGAFLGLGAGLPPALRTAIFVALVALFLVAMFVVLVRGQDMGRPTLVAGTLIMSGGISNLIDRILNQGAVIDFLNLGIGRLRTGVFNIADLAIVAGFVVLVWVYVRDHIRAAAQT